MVKNETRSGSHVPVFFWIVANVTSLHFFVSLFFPSSRLGVSVLYFYWCVLLPFDTKFPSTLDRKMLGDVTGSF